MRVTAYVRDLRGLEKALQARNRAQKRRVLEASEVNGHELHSAVVGLANRLTGYMASQTRLEFTRGGYNFYVGYHAADFVGQENTLADPPFTITTFYPPFVIYGTSRYAGNDFLSEARRALNQRHGQRYRRAIRGQAL